MKKDFWFALFILFLFVPFIFCDDLYAWYRTFNSEHGLLMSFFKFAVLSTLGEILGLRISTGSYYKKQFGIVPRMVVWGLLGMGINMAMIIFSSGVPSFLEYLGVQEASSMLSHGSFIQKIGVAFAISVGMNVIFAPLFMTFHKITDTHIIACRGSLRSLLTPIPMGEIIRELNWEVQWNFVFKKTIPLFWIPAHTITFLLSSELRVLFAAFLGIVLGVLLAVAARKK